MFSTSRSHLRYCGGRKPELGRRYVRPLLEALEDRVTPSGAPMMPDAPSLGAALTPSPQAAAQLNFTFTPSRILLELGNTSVHIAATITDPTGAPVNGGTVTFTMIDEHGNPVGNPVAATVSTTGQVAADFALPANLRIGPYFIKGVYSNSDSPYDGASGTGLLDIILGPIPVQPKPSSQPQALPQTSSPMSSPLSLYQTALTLYLDGVELALDTLEHQPTGGTQASIDAAMPGAGPWGQAFELAGELAVYQRMGNGS
jgi:hypothetical protein